MQVSKRMKVFYLLIVLGILLALLGSFRYFNDRLSKGNETMNAPFETEVIVRTVKQFRTKQDILDFVNLAAKYHVNVISMNVKQDEDDEVPSGHVFYQSKIAPIAAGYESFDALRTLIDAAHVQGIKVHAWIPQFHDQAAFGRNPEWPMMALINDQVVPYNYNNAYFVNPFHEGVQAYERSIIREVIDNYEVDGVVLDWIRLDDFHMDVSDYTVRKYTAQFGYSPRTIDFSSDNAQRRQWNEWRTDQIANYVSDVRADIAASANPDVQLGVYILPPEFIEVGQDVAKFKDYIDFVAPMAYYDDWGFDPEWVYDDPGILHDAWTKTSGTDVMLVPTLDESLSDAEYRLLYYGIRQNYPEVTRLSFFSYFAWLEERMAGIDKRRTWPEPDWNPLAAQDYDADLPSPWKARNIGLRPGNASYDASIGEFTLSSSSTDIWGVKDRANYVYRTLEGDGSIVAEVRLIENMGSWAKAGVMIRNTLDSNAVHVEMMLTAERGATFQYRETVGGRMTDQFADAAPPTYVKLTRNGDVFTGSISDDGVTWTIVGSVTLAMNEQVYVGIAVGNPDSFILNRAVFRNVQLSAAK